MNPEHSGILQKLFHTQEIAALGTLHQGRPFVSMVPFAILPGRGWLVIHVSQLASHTQDMLECADVSLMIASQPTADVPAQAVPRITVQGEAVRLDREAAEYPAARAAYLERFPGSGELFGFADFSLFAIVPVSARFVGGFAAARTLTAAALAGILGH